MGTKACLGTIDTKSRGLRNAIASFLILDENRTHLTKQTDRIYALFKKYGIDLEIVPIVSNFELKDTVDEILLEADGDSVVIPKDYKGTHLREGLVIRTSDGKLSFKAVSNKFLVKHSE